MSCPFHVLFRDGPPKDWQRAARVLDLASPTLSRSDATKACRLGHGLVSSALPKAEAEEAARALTKAGFPALAIPRDQVILAPRAFTIVNADAYPDGFHVQTRVLGQMQTLPWECLRLICVLRVQAVLPQASGAVMWVSGGDETPHMESVEERPPRSDAGPQDLLELYALQPLIRLRIRRHAFNCDHLGTRRTNASEANFRLLVTDILRYAPNAARAGLVDQVLAGRRLSSIRRILSPLEHEQMVTALLTREALAGLRRR
jgi:hypothetical protein